MPAGRIPGNMRAMPKTTKTQAQIEVLHAAVLALCAALPPERAAYASRMFSAALADLETLRKAGESADQAAAAKVASVLRTLAR